jgi:hypothetical protein
MVSWIHGCRTHQYGDLSAFGLIYSMHECFGPQSYILLYISHHHHSSRGWKCWLVSGGGFENAIQTTRLLHGGERVCWRCQLKAALSKKEKGKIKLFGTSEHS